MEIQKSEFDKNIIEREKRESAHDSTVRIVRKEIQRRGYKINVGLKSSTIELVPNLVVHIKEGDRIAFIRWRKYVGKGDLRLNCKVVETAAKTDYAILIVARIPMLDAEKPQDTKNWIVFNQEQCKAVVEKCPRHKSIFINYDSSYEFVIKQGMWSKFDDILPKTQ